MAEDKPKKTLDQIVNDTLSSNFGISDADLQLLFEDPVAPATQGSPQATATPTVEPATPMPAAATQAAQADSTAVPPTVPSQPDRSKDLENSLRNTNTNVSQLATVVEELLRKSQANVPEPTRNQPNPLDEISDEAIIQAPKDSVVKLVNTMLRNVLPAAFAEYDTDRRTRDYLDRFRSAHNDFDELRPIMRQIVAENPAVNDTPAALPRVYDEARRRKVAAIDAVRRELNVPASQSNAPQLTEEDLLTKLEQRIAEKIRKRRSASVPLTSTQTAPIYPTDRMAPRDVGKPMTVEEKMFQDMLDSGPNSSKFLQGLELAATRK